MTQTIQQRRALADRVHRAPVSISRRREQRANVIQWREQARSGSKPVSPVSARRKPLISARVENVILVLVGVAALLISRQAGVL
jgi:hypothetical protein